MTKRQQSIINSYNRSNMYSLNDAYKSYSVYKARAEQSILNEMQKNGGWGYRILGANSCQFSCAYLINNKDDGNIKIVYHTASNRFVFDY